MSQGGGRPAPAAMDAPEVFPAAACVVPPSWAWQSNVRVLRSFGAKLCERENRIALCTSGSFVYAVALYEGWLHAHKGHPSRLRFSFRYARAQLLPSIIWLTASPQDVAATGGYPPSARGLPVLRSVDCAHLRHRIFVLQCLRSVVFGFCGIAQILQMVDSASLAKHEYQERVRSGEEELFSGLAAGPAGVSGRVLRLAGRTSDSTITSLSRYGPRVVPVYEDPNETSTAGLLRGHSHGHTVPLYYRIPARAYGKSEFWGHVNFDDDWFIATKSGRRLLVAEADSSVGDEALALSSEESTDLTPSDFSQGFRMVRRKLHRHYKVDSVDGAGAKDGSVALARVVLIDEETSVRSGGGGVETVREYLASRDEADIYIDAKRPLLAEIKRWVESCRADASTPVVFDTPNPRYFRSVKTQLERHGITVMDRCDPEASPGLPHLVYHNTTPETVNAALSLIHAEISATGRLCVLLDHPDGLADMRDQGLTDVPYVCSSEVFDRKFAQVRNLLAQDVPSAEVQAMLDAEGQL
eukprot:TRINITY_DN22607_c0_g1_i1.p1 TRINITY_DN22607_c0_g1~~TRINITY_DN22607_c0_g1_i1.p1  ORF type:complete len:526 (+),score=132.20 TRINITY_DN22607_c0_g1_i1:67-1644(+)